MSPIITTEKYDVFISYARADYKDENNKPIPNNVISKITSEFKKNKISYWIDEKGIHTGDNYGPIIAQAIQNSSVFVFVSTQNSNSSRWVQSEIALANRLKKPILPIKCDDSDYAINVILDLITLDYCDYINFPDTAIDKLVESVKERLPEYQEYKPHKEDKEPTSDSVYNEQIVKSLDQIANLTQYAVSRIIDSNSQSIFELHKIADSAINHLCETEERKYRSLEESIHFHLEEISNKTNKELGHIASSIHQLRDDFTHSIEQQRRTNNLLEQITSIWSELCHKNLQLEKGQDQAHVVSKEIKTTIISRKRIANLFFVIDVSGSMTGDRITGLNSAMRRFITNFNNNHPIADDAEVHLSVISYATDVQWQYETPTNIDNYKWIDLKAGGLTNLGRAIPLLHEQLNTYRIPGGILPLVIFISDGLPTDSFDREYLVPAKRFSISIGPDAMNIFKFTSEFKIYDTSQLDSTLDAIMNIYLADSWITKN